MQQTVGFWKATGDLVINKVSSNQINPLTNVWFDAFDKPNGNYDPNWYKRNYSYYESPNPYACMSYQSENNSKYEWLTPPITDKKLRHHNS